MANILYRKQKRQKSLDNGVTWIDTGEYRVGDILENPSNCSSTDSKQCRWVELDASEGYYCDGYNKYTVQVEECTENGIIWTKTGYSRKGDTLLASNSTDCGYTPSTGSTGDTGSTSTIFGGDDLIYSWNGTQSTYYLNGTQYTANSNPLETSLSDLGINSLTSVNKCFSGSNITQLTAFPDTSNVTNMSDMFTNCSKLTSLDLSGINTANVTQMQGMFYYCTSLTELDLSMFDTSNVWNTDSIFYGCKDLTTLNVSGWDVSNITKYTYMFTDCDSLTKLIIGEDDDYDWWCNRLTEAGIAYSNCESIIEVGSNSSGGTSGGTGTTSSDELAFAWTGSSTTETYRINETTYTARTNPYSTTLTDLGISNFTSASQMFRYGMNITAITSIPDTSNVTTMTQMFYGCYALTSLDLSNFNTSACTIMYEMFDNCHSLTSLDLSNFNTSACTNMYFMFNGCRSLNSLDLSNFDTSNVTDMSGMFEGCYGLTSVDVSSFNTSSVTSMRDMFFACESLTSIDLSNFNISKVTDMSYMFSHCTSLQTLDVSSWDISKVTYKGYMFNNCTSLTTLKVKQGTYNWWLARLTDAGIQSNVTITEV